MPCISLSYKQVVNAFRTAFEGIKHVTGGYFMAKKVKSEEQVKEELRKAEQEMKRLRAENKALSEENEDENDENEDETGDENAQDGMFAEGTGVEADILRERIKERLMKKAGTDTIDNPLFNVVGVVSEKKTMEDPEKLGNIFTNITLDEIDEEDLQTKIGNMYGPGHYQIMVTYKGQMQTRFSWFLSPRKFKKPVDDNTPAAKGGTGEVGLMIEMLKLQAAQSDKLREVAESRNHDMMMKMMDSRKDMDLEKILTIADKMANKSSNGFDPMSLIMKVMDRSIDMGERAQEIKDNKGFVDYIGETLKDIVVPVISTYAKGAAAKTQAAAQVSAAYEVPKQVTTGAPTAAQEVKQEVTPAALVSAGVIIGMVNDMFFGYAQDPTDPDDPDTYAQRINVMGIHSDFKKSILTMDNETLITRLSTFSKDINEMFLDANFKNYAILIFDGVKKLNTAPEPEVKDEPETPETPGTETK